MSAGSGIATGFFTSAATGILAGLLAAPRDQLGRFFSVLHSGMALIFIGLVLPFRPNSLEVFGRGGGPTAGSLASLAALGAAGATLLFVGLLYRPGGRGGIGVVPGGRAGTRALAVACCAALVATGLDGWSVTDGGVSGWLHAANALAAAALIGSVVVAMLLGHWYLVRINLPEGHLVRFAALFGAATVVRAVLLLCGVLAWGAVAAGGNGRVVRALVVDRGLFFWQRLLLGIVLPGALALMAYRTARMRATMSATGILYIAVIFVMIGEFLARYLVVSGAGPL